MEQWQNMSSTRWKKQKEMQMEQLREREREREEGKEDELWYLYLGLIHDVHKFTLTHFILFQLLSLSYPWLSFVSSFFSITNFLRKGSILPHEAHIIVPLF